MESKIKTTIITDYESATAILVGFSRFLNYNTYFTFYIHFVSIRGFIFSNSVTIIVRFVYNRLLRILQEQEAFCEKVGDDLENVAYRCNATGNVSTVNSIQIEPVFNFSSQDVKIVGISPIAHTFMDNIQNATGDNDDLLNSNYYILDHANISENKRYNIFNISGIISDQKPNFTTNDLLLKVNAEKDTIEADVNCTIVEINGSNYTLNCTGEKNILYDLQSAISIIDNDVLIVNFDENATSEIKFGSNWNRFRREGSSGMSGGIIALIVIVLLVALVAIITLVLLRKKIFRKQHEDAQESTVYNLNA